MKKILFLILITTLNSFLFSAKKSENASLQSTVDFYENLYGREIKDLPNSKHLKRWYHHWETRLGKETPNAFEIYNFIQKEEQDSKKNFHKQIQNVNWKSLGPINPPNNYEGIGRINVVRFHPNNSKVLFVATAGGGAWRSNDGGATWNLLPTTDYLSMSYSDIAVSKSNPNVIYLASGDANGTYGTAGDYYSIGVLKSTDGGQSFQVTGLAHELKDGQSTAALYVDPTNENYVVVTTQAGIYLTEDGGAKWDRVSPTAMFKDLEKVEGADGVLLATSYNISGGANIFRSADNGKTWNNVRGIGGAVRADLAVEPNFPNYVVAVACGTRPFSFKSFMVSTDAGLTWIEKSNNNNAPNTLGRSSNGGYPDVNEETTDQGQYDLSVAISPQDQNLVFVGGINYWYTDDAGITWNYYPIDQHVDQHDLKFSSTGDSIYFCNDGGIFVRDLKNGGHKMISNGLMITQFYKSSVSSTLKYYLAGAQDNSTFAYNSTNNSWVRELGGDGMDCHIDPTNENRWFGSSQYGSFSRSDNAGGNWQSIISEFITGQLGSREEGAWITPFVIDPKVTSKVYVGFYNVWRSTSSGSSSSWQKISNFSNSSSLEILEISEDGTHLYASNGATIWTSYNSGTNWQVLTSPISNIGGLAIDPVNPRNIYITAKNYTDGNKVYSLNNGTWTNISGNLPNVPVNVIKYQKNSPNRIYIGNEIGVYFMDYNSLYWERMGNGLPYCIVNDLEINYTNKKLIAATYGRGLWEADLIDCDETTIQIEADGELEFCDGESVTLSVKNPTGNYTWSNGETGNSINVGTKGIYSVKSNSDCPQKSNYIEVSVLNKSTLSINSSLGDTICVGDSTRLSSSLGFSEYIWEDGFNGRNRFVKDSGIYKISAKNSNGCYSDTLIEITVVEPAKPLINKIDSNLVVSYEGTEIKWYYEDAIIEGANSKTYSPKAEGKYSVELKTKYGCNVLSDKFDFLFSSVEDNLSQIIKVIQNNNNFDIYVPISDNYEISLYDLNGKLISSDNYYIQKESLFTYDLINHNSSVYIMQIKSAKLNHTHKLILE